ncbi:MAG: peptidoglycan DD-metalloendopeptidase family protein [Deltaproteobacteria bacterium]|nr:peptidoglycan DD-metalloendopeptidase family protein [Deltaproteobacteria bacterium]
MRSLVPLTAVLIAPLALAARPAASREDPFAEYLRTEIPPADGFDFPVGDPDGRGSYEDRAGKTHHGWYVALAFGEKFRLGIHPGEDWNGKGGGSTDAGQPVCAVAAGKVIYAEPSGALWGRVVMIQHVYYENHERKRIRSLYAHLGEIRVKPGDLVRRRQPIGTIGQDPQKLYSPHLHLELRRDESLPAIYWPSAAGKDRAWVAAQYAHPTRFIRAHRKLFVPPQEPTLVLVDQASYRMRLYRLGQLVAAYEVGFGQGQGRKRRRGDLRTPKGMYFVVSKRKGHFGGDFGAYYGGHWIKLNYPNLFDAAWGRRQDLVSSRVESEIGTAWARRQPTSGKTRLGGGIGFHGWIAEWEDGGPRHLSWGCIVLHNRDMPSFYKQVSKGAMVVIF